MNKRKQNDASPIEDMDSEEEDSMNKLKFLSLYRSINSCNHCGLDLSISKNTYQGYDCRFCRIMDRLHVLNIPLEEMEDFVDSRMDQHQQLFVSMNTLNLKDPYAMEDTDMKISNTHSCETCGLDLLIPNNTYRTSEDHPNTKICRFCRLLHQLDTINMSIEEFEGNIEYRIAQREIMSQTLRNNIHRPTLIKEYNFHNRSFVDRVDRNVMLSKVFKDSFEDKNKMNTK